MKYQNEIPFNSIKLQQFLESMIELKEFHLYVKLNENIINYDKILSEFKNEYWFDHNLSFGMHGNYFYTLPFHFDYLYEFVGDFRNIKSTNPNILINNPRIWYHVKSVELKRVSEYDRNFVKELKIKMPKLNLIKFRYHFGIRKPYASTINDEREKLDLRLDNVTTLQFTGGSIEDEKDWIIYSLPNLRHLILSPTELPSIENELVPILNQKIQRLDISQYSKLKQLTEISYVYFSNVQYINFHLNDFTKSSQECADIIMKILRNFKNLKSLLIYIPRKNYAYIKYLNMNTIMKNYSVKHFLQYSLFLKWNFN
jgi:hypothetical protein